MREIKFRAWLMTKQCWILFDIEGIPKELENDIDYSLVHQFTCFRDKNDKDIYEGDIVKYAVKKKLCPVCSAKDITSHLKLSVESFCPSCGTQTVYDDFITVAEVVYSKAAFGYQSYPDEDHYQTWPVYANEIYVAWVEVVGNIYENAELLNKKELVC